MLGIILTMHIRGVDVTSWDLIPASLVSGLGLGTVIAPLLNVILAGVPGRDAGSASGVLTTFQQLGGAVGVAVVGVVFFGMLSGRAGLSCRAGLSGSRRLPAQLLAMAAARSRLQRLLRIAFRPPKVFSSIRIGFSKNLGNFV